MTGGWLFKPERICRPVIRNERALVCYGCCLPSSNYLTCYSLSYVL
jgi:hypothetical protein